MGVAFFSAKEVGVDFHVFSSTKCNLEQFNLFEIYISLSMRKRSSFLWVFEIWYILKAPFCSEVLWCFTRISLGCLPAPDPALTRVHLSFAQVIPVAIFTFLTSSVCRWGHLTQFLSSRTFAWTTMALIKLYGIYYLVGCVVRGACFIVIYKAYSRAICKKWLIEKDSDAGKD